jgi:hypothetical protein
LVWPIRSLARSCVYVEPSENTVSQQTHLHLPLAWCAFDLATPFHHVFSCHAVWRSGEGLLTASLVAGSARRCLMTMMLYQLFHVSNAIVSIHLLLGMMISPVATWKASAAMMLHLLQQVGHNRTKHVTKHARCASWGKAHMLPCHWSLLNCPCFSIPLPRHDDILIDTTVPKRPKVCALAGCKIELNRVSLPRQHQSLDGSMNQQNDICVNAHD